MQALAVRDMPIDLKLALQQRGHSPGKQFTFREALREWAAWEIGDSSWADNMLDMQSEFETDLREAQRRA